MKPNDPGIREPYMLSGGRQVPSEIVDGRTVPGARPLPLTELERHYHAVSNFVRTFDIRPTDTVVMLTDRLLDPRVVSAISGLCTAQGVQPTIITSHTTQHFSIPEDVKPILEKASFVVSTWYCSVMDPYCVALRRDRGQRWVKITFFRNLDLLETPQARFPTEIISALIRATASRVPAKQDVRFSFSDARGSDLSIDLSAAMMPKNFDSSRWRGELSASLQGCFVHYLPIHGPNLYQRDLVVDRPDQIIPINGTLYAQCATAFPKPFQERVGVRFENDRVVDVSGSSPDAAILRDMLIGAQMTELGCGFNPKWPRHQVYPAGSNSPGALHFGLDMVKPSDFVRRMMPNWEEPPVHLDLVSFDCTAEANGKRLVTDGYLEALRDPEVVALASHYGDAVDLLENWPD